MRPLSPKDFLEVNEATNGFSGLGSGLGSSFSSSRVGYQASRIATQRIEAIAPAAVYHRAMTLSGEIRSEPDPHVLPMRGGRNGVANPLILI